MFISTPINSKSESVCLGYILNIAGCILLICSIVNVAVTSIYLLAIDQNVVYNIMSYVIFTHCIHVLKPVGMAIICRQIKISDCQLNINHVIITLNKFIACLVCDITSTIIL